MNDKIKLLILISAATSCTLLISNLAATKLWDFCGIAIDGGIIIFPVSYVLGDIAVEFFGKEAANRIVLAALAMNAIAVIVFILVGALPPFVGWDNQASYEAILGFAPRIVLGSLLAFAASGLTNNYIFERLRCRLKGSKFYQRALFSSVVGRLVDSLIFETVAFFGILPLEDFIRQAIFAYLAGMMLETAMTPASANIVYNLHRRLDS